MNLVLHLEGTNFQVPHVNLTQEEQSWSLGPDKHEGKRLCALSLPHEDTI